MRKPFLAKRFAQPSSSGSSHDVTVTLSGRKIDRIEHQGKLIQLDPLVLDSLARIALEILRSSKRQLSLPEVLALVIADFLSQQKTPQPPKQETAEQSPNPSQIPSIPRVEKTQDPHYALVFSWSRAEATHLDLLDKLSVKKSRHTKRNQFALDKKTSSTIHNLLQKKKGPQKIERLLNALVNRINQEENPRWDCSEQERISHSVQKAQQYLKENLGKLSKVPTLSTLNLSMASSTDLSSVTSSESRISLFSSPSSSDSRKSAREVRFAPGTS